MPAVAPYIPAKQSMFDVWLLNFSSLITAAPATYGLLASDAVTIAGYYATWHAAYTLVTSPTTKTAAVVSAKNDAYASVVPPIRTYAQQIVKNAGVTAANKVALGLNPQTSAPSPVTPPASTPVLLLQGMAPGVAILRYRDSAASVSVKSKPFGVTTCEIRGAVLMAPPVTAASLPVMASATKSPYLLSTVGLTVGGTLYLAARWVTRKQLTSPFSPIITTTVV